jgi:PAS domain S-box/diguanylate cyclase (GGDEF) domain
VRLMKQNKNYSKKKKDKFILDQFILKLFHIGKMTNPVKEAARIAGVYAALGFLWVLLSDRIVETAFSNKHTIAMISMIKGWAYVIITGMIVYLLVFSAIKRIHQDAGKIDRDYQELCSTYEELEASHEELMASEEELRQQYESLMESQKQLRLSEERYRLVSEATNDGIWEEFGNKRFFSDRWLQIMGYSRQDMEKMEDWRDLIHPQDKNRLADVVLEHLTHKNEFYNFEYRIKTKAGKYIWIQTRGKAMFDKSGEVYRMAGSHTDITEFREYQQKLLHMAYHDTLTQLPNRQALLDKKIVDFLSGSDSFMVLFMDVKNFKFINDTLGHDFGDQLIKLIAERYGLLKAENNVLYRLGGDEFVFINSEAITPEKIEQFTRKILDYFKEPFRVNDSTLHISISIGVSLYPEHGKNVNELLRYATIAMHKAVENGGSNYMVYTPYMNDSILERMLMEKKLRLALENNKFELYYQPQYDIIENRIIGFEALIRWRDDELGQIPPLKFIPIAEETRLIIPIGEWVIKEACTFLKKLHKQGITNITTSVNISILQLLQDNFVELVFDILNQNQLEPECLELEITESILMESFDSIIDKLTILQSEGIKIALDDFGKGYSSLSYLKQLPITTLKIDKSFIDCISEEQITKSLTGQIVMIGNNMGLNVIAEGVETIEQLEYLSGNHCRIIQGYLFSKPLHDENARYLISQKITLNDIITFN